MGLGLPRLDVASLDEMEEPIGLVRWLISCSDIVVPFGSVSIPPLESYAAFGTVYAIRAGEGTAPGE